MFRLNLVLRRKNDAVMIFSPPPWFRILFLAFSALIILGIFTIAADDGEGSNFILPIIIAAACIIASLYEESWIINRNEKTITSRSGLMILRKTFVISFNEIENLELFFFLRGAESDGKKDREINLSKPFSKENTAEVAGTGPKIIHKKYHQELRLNLRSGERKTLESLDSRRTEELRKKAGIIAEFSGIKLIN